MAGGIQTFAFFVFRYAQTDQQIRQWQLMAEPDLRQRSHIHPETGCWMVRGARHKGSVGIWLPSLGKSVSLTYAMGWLLTGKPKVANTTSGCVGRLVQAAKAVYLGTVAAAPSKNWKKSAGK